MKYSKSSRSTNIPNYILSGLRDVNEERKIALKIETSPENSNLRQAFSSGTMDVTAFLTKVPNIRHGAGTFEAKEDMSIWEVRGDKIFRRKDRTMEVEAVLYALNASDDDEEE